MGQHDEAGRILVGRYRLKRLLGEGAHGRVYLAQDLGRGGTPVAVKLVDGVVGGTRREAADDVLRTFRHPCWASVTDGGTAGPDAWFQVVRYVPGGSLDRLAGPQPVDLVWRFLEDGARVLGALHRHGIIHYDVTPGNWLLTDEGGSPRFVLTDGGLAHVGPVSGSARGTPLYMAPEVTQSGSHDHRADLYSLGLVAFRLATGEDAFQGGAGEVLGRRRRGEAPRASGLRPDLPPGLDELIADLLARDPNARPEDALALLARLAAATERDVRPFLDEEGLAAAEGGPLVGRTDALARFRRSLDVLAERVPVRGEASLRRPATPIEDAVLVLRGVPGSGTTRLAAEMRAAAREADVPVLLLSGSEAVADPRQLLPMLVEGLAALDRPGEIRSRAAPSDRARRMGLGDEERAHAAGRAIERFIRVAEAAARRTPFVLVVEGFTTLPPRARGAVLALSRHLLSRRESSGGMGALPAVLVADVGSGEHAELLIPDAEDPERPVVDLGPLDAPAIATMCAQRFPGLEMDAADLDRLHRQADGLPGSVVALLAEGCRRKDLRYATGRWLWNVDHIQAYAIERGLAPGQATALRAADPHLRRLLLCLALVETPLDAGTLERAGALEAGQGVPTGPLVCAVSRGPAATWALATLAIRKAVLARAAPEALRETARVLTHALAGADGGARTLDRAALHARLGEHAAVLDVLRAGWGALSHEQRTEAQPLLEGAVGAECRFLDTVEGRATVSGLLEYGPVASDIARRLAVAVEEPGTEVETALRTAAVLENARHYAEAVALLERVGAQAALDPATTTDVWTRLASLQYDLHQMSRAQEALHVARRALRAVGRGDHAARRLLLARYLMIEAQRWFLDQRPWRAALCLRAALRAARRGGGLMMRVRILNNLGIVLRERGDPRGAERSFRKSLRLRTLLGDVEGVIKTNTNLGRLKHLSGELVRSAGFYQAAAALALRHAQYYALVDALRSLARVYDQQLNPRLGTTTHYRAAQVAIRIGYKVGIALAAWDLAPLAAATGKHRMAEDMLRHSAGAARQRVTAYARATHDLTACLTHLHRGDGRRAATYLARAARRRSQLFPENRLLLDGLLSCFGHAAPPARLPARPGRFDRARYAYRSAVWYARAGRPSAPPPPLPLARFVPTARPRPAAPGRERRVLVEVALHAVAALRAVAAERILGALERHLAQTGEARLQARVLAREAALPSGASPAIRTRQFSRAVALLGVEGDLAPAQVGPVPHEHAAAARRVATTLRAPRDEAWTDAGRLHALAHRALLAAGFSEAPDDRVAAALRRVLEATGRMNAGAGLDDLLQAMTRHTVEITGAERACVVLMESAQENRMRLATSVSSAEARMALEELSHTVIQRVLASHQPLLLHDVFDDEELLGRPSITSLSLRSILCVPMVRGDQLYGIMYADSSSAAGSFDRVDLEVLSLFAEQAAAALETHRLVTDLQNSMAELRSMQERLIKGERLRTMGELSSGVAHEFNNLLTAILARVQLIALNPLGHELKHDLTMIERACLDAAEVVRRMQAYTRNQRQERFSRLDLAEICRDAVEFLRPLWSTRRRHARAPVRVRVDAESGLPVQGDPTELREVVTNLLKNALDALAEGGEIDVVARRAKGRVHLTVTDDGPGIPPEVLARVFDPFFTTKGERGTGLGLCLSQQIVERHGGEIRIDSRPGAGTTVAIELPEAAGEASAATLVACAAPAPAVRILVVDDDEKVRAPLCAWLKRSGYDVDGARDAAEALALATGAEYALVITDIGMPGTSGIELCRQLTAARPGQRVILMSGWADTLDPSCAAQAGALDLLPKPFALQQVTDLIRAALAAPVGGAPAP